MADLKNGYYSLVQYCPDPSRGEAANVGVLLLCPELRFIDTRLAGGNDRVRRFFGGKSVNLARVEAAKRSIQERVRLERASFRSLEDLQVLIQTRGNELVLTPPRSVKVADPVTTLTSLFEELVGGRARVKREPRFPELDRVFRRASLVSKVQRNPPEVLVPVVNRPLKAAFAFRNGSLNLIRPELFSDKAANATGTAMRLAVEGDLLSKHGIPQAPSARLIVVPHFSDRINGEIRGPVLQLFREYNVRTVELGSLEEFAEEVERTAH
jgi:hypothetical protein